MKSLLVIIAVYFTLPASAFASVCMITFNQWTTTVTCDDKIVTTAGGPMTNLQRYLNDGYKLVGQSSSNGNTDWTLIK